MESLDPDFPIICYAYEAAIERFNASVGMDERPPFPTPEAFEINVSEEQIPDVEWDLDLEEEYEN